MPASGDFRRRRAITWPFASPGNPPAAPILARSVIVRVLPRRPGLVLRARFAPSGNPAAVPFAVPLSRRVISLPFRLRRGSALQPRLTGLPPSVPHGRPDLVVSKRPLPRRGLVIASRFPSPGNPAPQPILRAGITPPRFRRRAGAVYLERFASPGNPVIGPPSHYTLNGDDLVRSRNRRRPGAVIKARFASPGDPSPPPPPPSQYLVVNPWVIDPRRKNRLGRVIMPRQAEGLFKGEPLRPKHFSRPRKPTAGQVILPRTAPFVFTQPTPPVYPSVSRPRFKPRPGRVWMAPMGPSTFDLTAFTRTVSTSRPRLRPGLSIHPSFAAQAPDLTAAYRMPVQRQRPKAQPGLVIKPRWLYTGNTNVDAFPAVKVQTPRQPFRRGEVVYPRLERKTITGGSSQSALSRTAAAVRRRLRAGLVILPRMLPGAPGLPQRQGVVIGRRRLTAAAVIRPRLFPPTAGTPLPGMQSRVVMQPQSGRRRGGRVVMARGSAFGTLVATIALLPDPFAATSETG